MRYNSSKPLLAVLMPLLLFLVSLSGCAKLENVKTQLEIIDNGRHYFPILQEEELTMQFIVRNIGKEMFVLSDLHTSCGCITVDKSTVEMIPPGREGVLLLKYDSSRNVGFVKHYITLYGNFVDAEYKEIVFDLHVVPNSLYTKDYEEIYFARKAEQTAGAKALVDAENSSKDYWLDDPKSSEAGRDAEDRKAAAAAQRAEEERHERSRSRQ